MTSHKPFKISNTPMPERPPHKFAMLKESRIALNVAGMMFTLAASSLKGGVSKVAAKGLPIIMFPGFASDDRYMKPLGKYLANNGYRSEGWGLGLNLAGADLKHTLEDLTEGWNVVPKDDYSPETYKGEGGVPYLCDVATKRVAKRAKELDSKVILIGWSLGGYIAREVARDLPNQVAQVITMGSPVIGGPKYTAAAPVFKTRGFDLDWIESEASKRENNPITQPITTIYSKSDAIVNWQAAVDRYSPNVKHIRVNAAHLGMGFNTQIWKHILDALENPPDH